MIPAPDAEFLSQRKVPDSSRCHTNSISAPRFVRGALEAVGVADPRRAGLEDPWKLQCF